MFRRNLVQRRLRQRFAVTPVKGVPFEGVLTGADGDYYVFADVLARPDGAVPREAPGELYIRLDNVAYIQTVPAV